WVSSISASHFWWLPTGSTLIPITLQLRLSNSGLRLARYSSSVVHTGVKSLGWENRIAQPFPIHSWKLIVPWVVSAVKFGASSLMRSNMGPSSLMRASGDRCKRDTIEGLDYSHLTPGPTSHPPIPELLLPPLPPGSTGNPPASGSGEAWFEPRRGNSKARYNFGGSGLFAYAPALAVSATISPVAGRHLHQDPMVGPIPAPYRSRWSRIAFLPSLVSCLPVHWRTLWVLTPVALGHLPCLFYSPTRCWHRTKTRSRWSTPSGKT